MPLQAPSAPAGPLGALGGFELLEKIGQGAMGTVFKARQRSLDRIVALKVLPPSFAKDQRFIERFQREARAVARLTHHHIVQAIDSGKDEATGLWYFAMEYVDGPSLGRLLKEQGALPERQLLEIGRQIAQALECAHGHRIVHRDVKPDNILLTSAGEAKLADLGLARRAGEEGAAAGKPGAALCTPNYMAPEQIRGQLDRVDVRTDLYALGATLFHLATGQPPFSGTTDAAIMAKHLTEKPPLAHRVSGRVGEPFSRLILNLMQKEPEQRPQTPAELIAQFDRILELTGSRKRAPVRATTGPRSSVRGATAGSSSSAGGAPAPERKSGAALMIMGVVALLALGGGAGWYFSFVQGKSRERTAKAERERPAEPPLPPERKPEAVPEKPAVTEAKKTSPPESEEPAPPEPERKAVAEPAEKKGESAKAGQGEDQGLSIAKKEEPEPAAGAASGFRAEYFEGQAFQTLRKTASEPTLDVNWPTGGPPGVALGAGVSARWSGFVKPEESGPYCFEISAQQGARLYLDRCLLADLWSGRPSSGRTAPVNLGKGKKYLLTFELRCGRPPASAQVRWGRPGGALGPVTADPPETEAEGLPVGHLAGGWQVTYGQHGERQPVAGREWTIDHDWGGGAPVAGVGADNFWARWSGVVVPPETADYTLHVDVQQGAKLSIGNVLVLDAYHLPPGKTSTVPLRLEKEKRYAVQLEYRKRGEQARCRLTWSRPGQEPEPVAALAEGEENLAALGVGFQAEYGSGSSPTALLTRFDSQAGWDWRGGSPAHTVPADNFWANYTGWIRPPASGSYSFILDWEGGVRFRLDDCLLFDRYRRRDPVKEFLPEEVTVALEGGKHYFVRLEYWARLESKHLLFKWRAKDLPEQPTPGLPPEALRGGDKDAGRVETALLAEYGTAKEPLIKRLEGFICHEFGGGTPGPEIEGGHYWGRWSGGLRAKENGFYTFQLETDTAAEMKLNRISVLRSSKPGKAETRPIQFQKGTIFFLELAYTHRSAESAFFRFTWKPPGKTEFEPLPADVFLLSPEVAKTFNRAVPK
jgi:serine/threonine-protein kinase